MVTKDVLWKAIIEDLCEDFFHFFFPNEVGEIDIKKDFHFLDNELHKLFPESNTKGRIADKLIKFYLHSGEEIFVLAHIEVQGSRKVNFPKRMFMSFYRLFDKFNVSITALAILTDSTKKFHPKNYELGFWGTKLNYSYRTYKVLDKKQEDFKKYPNNPFAIVMEAVWIELQKNSKVNKGEMKFKVTKKLLESGFPKHKIQHLYNFIDYYIRLENDEEKLIFEKKIEPFVKRQKPMGIKEAIEQELRKYYKAEAQAEVKAKVKAEVAAVKAEVKAEAKAEVAEAKAETIISLHENGFSSVDIATFVKLELSYVEKILKNLNTKRN